MDFIEGTLELIAPKVYAQTYDETAQPTFGVIDNGQSGGTRAEINITTSSTTVRVGQEFTVDIEIDTAGIAVKQYDVILNFDAARLSVVDADSSIPGSQVEFLDTIFEVQNDTDNIVSGGQVTLRARTASGNALEISDRAVATITFQAQQNGNTVISPVEGINGVKLINTADIGFVPVVNSLTLNVSATGGSSSSSSRTSSSSTQTAQSSSSSSSSAPGGIDNIPNTGIVEDTVNAAPYIIGTLLLLLGIRLLGEKKPQENKSQ